MTSNIQPQKAPPVDLPKGSETCRLSIINTTCDITCPPSYLVEPNIKGHEWLNLPTYSFYIKHDRTGREILFDLGCRKDWYNSVPSVADLISNHVNGLKVEKSVLDILPEGNVNVEAIKALVLSHWHFDHCGDPEALPKSVDLIVGPKFKETFLPGYPSKEDSPFHEAAFEGRQVVEVQFSDDFKIGQFQAQDYFGDGSFYILNVPGHAVGHISGLVRTTKETFVFLGGDVCHFTGSIRPTKYVPMPDEIPNETPLEARILRPCPCSAFTDSHPDPANSRTVCIFPACFVLEDCSSVLAVAEILYSKLFRMPLGISRKFFRICGSLNSATWALFADKVKEPFYKVSTGPSSFYLDPPTAQRSVHALAEFDADPNVLIAIAHDPTSMEVLTFFPNGTMNDWQEKGWKKAVHWGFVNELPYNGQTVRPPLSDGLYKDGKRLRDLAGNVD